MHHDLRLLQLALLTPILACGGHAQSERATPSTDETANCADAECSAGAGSLPARDSETPRASGGAYCPDGLFPDSIEIRDQATLDQLQGCERLSGFITLHVFPGIDETPLQSLRDVDGGVEVYGGAEPVANPIDGFRALEETTLLSLQGLTLSDLRPLAQLKRIGPETSPLYSVPLDVADGGHVGGLQIFHCSGLTNLRGLDALESLQGILLRDNPDLTSLAGLEQLHSVSVLRVANTPLLDLSGIAERGLEILEVAFSALTRLNGLGNASSLKQLLLESNEALSSLEGGQVPAQLQDVSLRNNHSLSDLHGLEGLRSAQSITLQSNTALQSLRGLEGLTGVNDLHVNDQPQLQSISALGALESAVNLELTQLPVLSSLEGLSKLTSVEHLLIGATPSLPSLAGLGSTLIGDLGLSAIPHVDLTGSENITIGHNLSFLDIEQLSAPAGLPHIASRASLSIQDSPLLSDVQALAPLNSLSSLMLQTTGIESLDALSNLNQLNSLYLWDNPALQQIDVLSDVAGLETLSVRNNPVLLRLPVFSNTACDSCADFALELVDNATLQTGPGLPLVGHASDVLVSGNPALTSLTGIATLRFVRSLQVERNANLVALPLPQLQQAEQVVIHGNTALDDAPLAPLRELPDASVKIVSNLSGPAQFEPCPWTLDGVCDETGGDCAPGTDTADCEPYAFY